jgi:hypothetical protein
LKILLQVEAQHHNGLKLKIMALNHQPCPKEVDLRLPVLIIVKLRVDVSSCTFCCTVHLELVGHDFPYFPNSVDHDCSEPESLDHFFEFLLLVAGRLLPRFFRHILAFKELIMPSKS